MLDQDTLVKICDKLHNSKDQFATAVNQFLREDDKKKAKSQIQNNITELKSNLKIIDELLETVTQLSRTEAIDILSKCFRLLPEHNREKLLEHSRDKTPIWIEDEAQPDQVSEDGKSPLSVLADQQHTPRGTFYDRKNARKVHEILSTGTRYSEALKVLTEDDIRSAIVSSCVIPV